ncbi:MAG: hypothetical protein SGILL_010749, partial [Bacillariaceae sp.]
MAERRNNSNAAEFYNDDLEKPFAKGGFRFAAKGVYTQGYREGKLAVCKWFKKGHVSEHVYYHDDILAMEKAVFLVGLWNNENIITQMIRVNVPEVWTFAKSDYFVRDTKVLVEPFIENYKKFNSNTGWNDSSTPWPQVMQALSHFSYHASNGEYLLCDLQGGVYSKGAVLTDPAVNSSKKKFGITDLRSKGISSFFSQHRCNQFCRLHWKKPTNQHRYYVPQEGTSMSSSQTSSFAIGRPTMAPPPPRRFVPSAIGS